MEYMQKIKDYFSRLEDAFDTESIVLLRPDGIALYSKITHKKMDANTIGALASGLWQAASTLGSNCVEHKNHEFRLSFDTSGSGIYILPIKFNDEEFYLCALYENLLNPALFKRNLQIIANGLEEALKKQKKMTSVKRREEFLFDHISDEEMDSLFNFK